MVKVMGKSIKRISVILLLILSIGWVNVHEKGICKSNRIQHGQSFRTPKEISQKKDISVKTHSPTNFSFRNGSSVLFGIFKITAYTAGYESTGKYRGCRGFRITKTGTRVKEGRTVAADFKLLPPGTRIKIEGMPWTYIVEDTGGKMHGRRIDLYLEKRKSAIKWGVKRLKIKVVKWGIYKN